MKKILIVEDDLDINKLLQKLLEKENYEVVTAFSGTEGELQVTFNRFDLMICDLALPGMSGEELIEKVREKNVFQENIFPIIALTAKGALDDKVNVLELGADDYMTKPFEPRELLARIKVHLRRTDAGLAENKAERAEEMKCLVFRDIRLDPEAMMVTVNDQQLELTAHEFAIMKIMMESPKKVFSKEQLYESVWKNGYYGEDNTISVHISNIRKKIEKIATDEYITTVWGIGYRLNL